MQLDVKLLNDSASWHSDPHVLSHERRILETYDRRRFVISLADEVIKALDDGDRPGEIYFTSNAKAEKVQAFSTYLHETIHWWQHIGSFSGFVQTCIFPANAHLNYRHLMTIVDSYGPKKSIFKLLEHEISNPLTPARDQLNIVVNNSLDLKFFVAAIQKPSNLRLIGKDKFYEGRGHCIVYGYIALLSALSTFDPEFVALPNPTTWENAVSTRKKSQKLEYYHGSPIRIPPIGLHALFEGQVRFSQLQYLYSASGRRLDWSDFQAAGMLSDKYVEAFELFLHLTETAPPEHVLSSPVSLFLLICDLAINPTDGFPLSIRSFDTFIDNADPGVRFLKLCQVIKGKRQLFKAVTDYNRQEYLEISSVACRLAGITDPNAGLNAVKDWRLHSSLDQIVTEGETLNFQSGNMLMRLLMSKFMAYCEDKRLYPDFFCWPGARMSDPNAHTRGAYLFGRHQSLFTNRSDKRGIFPRLTPGVDPAQCLATLTDFYSWNVLYDMTWQWILEEGVFDLAFDWLTDGDNEEVFQWGNSIFHGQYGVRPENFQIL